MSLENKCDVMNNDIVKIDALFSSAFNTEPNLERYLPVKVKKMRGRLMIGFEFNHLQM